MSGLSTRPWLASPEVEERFGDHYKTLHKLGSGTFGIIHEAIARELHEDEAETTKDRVVAVKTVSRTPPLRSVLTKQDKSVSSKQNNSKTLERIDTALLRNRLTNLDEERAMLAYLDHANIIKIYEYFHMEESIWIVMELCRGGELFQKVSQCARRTGRGLDETEARGLLEQMLYAICYLHGCRIVHRDIKMENFVMLGDLHVPANNVVKLCDFGSAVQLTKEMPRAMERVGTLSYAAPEIYAQRGADLSADVWSVGVVIYIVLIGAKPFGNRYVGSRDEMLARISAGKFDRSFSAWHTLSVGAKDLIERSLVPNEIHRLDSRQMMRHKWMSDHSKNLSSPFSWLRGTKVKKKDFGSHASLVVQGMQSFMNLTLIRQLVIRLCAQLVSEETFVHCDNVVPWSEFFTMLDADLDGRLGLTEFVDGLKCFLDKQIGHTKPQLEQMARALDINGSGAIEWSEWLVIVLMVTEGVWLKISPEPLRTVLRMIKRSFGRDIADAVKSFHVSSTNEDHKDDTELCLPANNLCELMQLLGPNFRDVSNC